VNPDLRHFTLIHPCGLADRKATSMFKILGSEVSLADVRRRFVAHFSDVFETVVAYGTVPDITEPS
jgi:lipoate-protein ligase B